VSTTFICNCPIQSPHPNHFLQGSYIPGYYSPAIVTQKPGNWGQLLCPITCVMTLFKLANSLTAWPIPLPLCLLPPTRLLPALSLTSSAFCKPWCFPGGVACYSLLGTIKIYVFSGTCLPICQLPLT
jgi:hypothetical protein